MSYEQYTKTAPGVAPSWIAKGRGFKSLQQVADILGVNKKKLIRWYNNSPDYFMVQLNNAAVLLQK